MNPLLNLVTITNCKESTPVLQSVQGMPLLYTRHWRKVWLWSQRRDLVVFFCGNLVQNFIKQLDTKSLGDVFFFFRARNSPFLVFFLGAWRSNRRIGHAFVLKQTTLKSSRLSGCWKFHPQIVKLWCTCESCCESITELENCVPTITHRIHVWYIHKNQLNVSKWTIYYGWYGSQSTPAHRQILSSGNTSQQNCALTHRMYKQKSKPLRMSDRNCCLKGEWVRL